VEVGAVVDVGVPTVIVGPVVEVGGIGVDVGGIGVEVGGIGVEVGGIGVKVRVGGMGVRVGKASAVWVSPAKAVATASVRTAMMVFEMSIVGVKVGLGGKVGMSGRVVVAVGFSNTMAVAVPPPVTGMETPLVVQAARLAISKNPLRVIIIGFLDLITNSFLQRLIH
jgi:hypothetical protein